MVSNDYYVPYFFLFTQIDELPFSGESELAKEVEWLRKGCKEEFR